MDWLEKEVDMTLPTPTEEDSVKMNILTDKPAIWDFELGEIVLTDESVTLEEIQTYLDEELVKIENTKRDTFVDTTIDEIQEVGFQAIARKSVSREQLRRYEVKADLARSASTDPTAKALIEKEAQVAGVDVDEYITTILQKANTMIPAEQHLLMTLEAIRVGLNKKSYADVLNIYNVFKNRYLTGESLIPLLDDLLETLKV